MVKSTPRNPNRHLRKIIRFHKHHHKTHTLNPNPNPNPNPNLSPSPPNPLKRTSPSPSSSPSPSPSPPSSGTLLNRSLSGSGSNPDPRNPISSILHSGPNREMGQLPPLPPLPSQNLLRRSVSDPVPFGSFTPPPSSHKRFFDAPRTSLSGSGSGSGGERSPSSKRLRRISKKKGENGNIGLISNPTTTSNCCSKDEEKEEKKEKRERAVRAERLAGDWIMIIINCPCGSNYQLMISEVDKKCYYKLM